MTLHKIYDELKEAYKEENLNKLALELITLNKKQEFGILKQLAELIEPWTKIEINSEGKGFSKFMMMYHPDRGDFYRKQVDELYNKQDLEGLLQFTHILKIRNIEELTSTMIDYEDIDYAPGYGFDFEDTRGYSFEDYDGYNTSNRFARETSIEGYTFYEAVQLRMYGDTAVEFPSYYLEELDEIEMADSEISDLEGVQYCIHTENLDLSGNLISDLTPLWSLSQIRDLNIADNQVEYIDVLSNLQDLRNLNLANNQIDDISPLFTLDQLEYVELTGNPVTDFQVDQLREMGVSVYV
jgi:hypothetical protein